MTFNLIGRVRCDNKHSQVQIFSKALLNYLIDMRVTKTIAYDDDCGAFAKRIGEMIE